MQSSKSSDLLQGTLEILILKVVALEPVHGYAIAQRIRQISRDVLQIQQGSLYPALYRLEERGYVQAQWRESDQGRMAKFYSVTRKGAKQLEAERAQWERTAAAIALVLQAANL
jgi:transcriptional regulator